jgi:hypothetical protein
MSDVNVELGRSSSALISLNDADVRALAGIGSGAISLNDLRGKSISSNYIFSGGISSPHVEAYNWSSSGWGSKFTNPTGTASGYSSATSSTYGLVRKGEYVFAALLSSPRIWARVFNSSGWGTLSAAPQSTLDTSSNAIATNPAGTVVGTANSTTSPYLQIYPWTPGSGWNGGGFGTWYSFPSTPPTGTGESIAWSRSGDFVAIGHANSPRVSVYPFSVSSGFGTKVSNPATLPSTTARGVVFTNGAIIAASRSSSSAATAAFPEAWAWSDSTGFGTRYSNPSNGYKQTFPSSLAVSQNGSLVTATTFYNDTTSYALPSVHMWTWSDASGWGTYYTNPTGSPSSGTQNGTGINATSDAAAYAGAQSPTVRVWSVSSSGFGSKFADPSPLTTGTKYAVVFG